MITSQFLNSCTEDEQGILYLILCASLQPLGYQPSFSCVKFLKKNNLLKIFDVLKSQIIPENLHILENLQKKIAEEL
ncbi:MAG: hypothetical protein EBU90_12855 [Proteobacteria bacterium]|nr:hypothetical protein [Pseudomonadota bacterium]NBP15397.1 hypothetical protein [bacterium]